MNHHEQYTILCVDDIPENLYAYEIILKKLPHIRVIQSLSGGEALKVILREKIDLILLDIQMPEMDGYEFAKLLKSTSATKDIPIIFITAVFKQEEFVAKGFEVGAIDYMTKPLDDNLLLNRIRLYLNIFTQKDEAINAKQVLYEITQSIGDGLYVINKQGTLDYINNAALLMLGYQHFELFDIPIHDKIHPYDKERNKISVHECPIHKTFETKMVRRIANDNLLKKDGTLLPVTTVATPITKNGKVENVVCLFRDITNELKYKSIQQQMITSRNEMIFMLVEAIDKRDPYTAGHTQRVALYCEKIATYMGYPPKKIELLVNAAHLHDVGKISTPDSILLKPGHFEKDEYEIMKQHLLVGYNLISTVHEYEPIAEIMRYHHERYDGGGYPLGISGDSIPALARIMIVADAFDSMTTNRVYKKRKTVAEALEEIQELSKLQFHPEVVEAALIALKDLNIEEYLDQAPHNDLEEKRFAYYYHDRLSGCYNIEYIPIVLDIYFKNIDAFILKINLKKMNQYNFKYGWENGNKLIEELGKFLKERTKEKFIFRFYGDDFVILSQTLSTLKIEDINKFLSSFDSELEVTFDYQMIREKQHIYEDILKILNKDNKQLP